jgi:carbonic anhydrase
MKLHPVSAQEALARLREGNERFAKNLRSVDALSSQSRRQDLVGGQSPFATILSCSDSRAPAELLFDCGLGDLFVVRVAGNVVAPSLIGSVEFASAMFGTQLVVVMGHTNCGAVKATLDVLRGSSDALSPNVRDIVERISPAVTELMKTNSDPSTLMTSAIRANVRSSVGHLRSGSRLIEERIAAGHLQVVGAEYSLETGVVTFFS